jgi:hypothetical protein
MKRCKPGRWDGKAGEANKRHRKEKEHPEYDRSLSYPIFFLENRFAGSESRWRINMEHNENFSQLCDSMAKDNQYD